LIRLFAASQVLVTHAIVHLQLPGRWLYENFLVGLQGVPIFFVISGFLVTDSALRSDSTTNFFWKRALRIYPALIVNMLVLETALYISGQNIGYHYWQYPVALLTSLATASSAIAVYLTNIPGWYGQGFFAAYPSGVLWTLTIELSFYLVVPLVAWLATRSVRLAMGAVFVGFAASLYLAATVYTWTFTAEHPILDVLFPAYFWIFAIGILLRLTWPHVSRAFEGKALLWVPLYFFVLDYSERHSLGSIDFHYNASAFTAARYTFLAFAVISVAYTFSNASRVLQGWDLSYGIYLWHMFFIYTLLAVGVTTHWWLWAALLFCTIGTSALSWRCIERPASKLKHARLRKLHVSRAVQDRQSF
jgi:peptidoglycan/LPS O-acetylase OafA/YrhL